MSEEEKRSYYAIIPANVRYDDELTPNAKLLYGEITALTNEKGYCWASNNYFARLYKTTPVTISRWVKALKDKGYITIQMNYKDGTKEIVNRYIQICREGINKNDNTPINKNVKDNNTSINNTFNNTYEIYSPAKEERDVIPYKEICDYLNKLTNSNYRHSTKKTKDLIKARFNEGFSLEDFKVVIEKKSGEWMNSDMQKYLRPETLFGTKFESYLNQQVTKKVTSNPFIEVLLEG